MSVKLRTREAREDLVAVKEILKHAPEEFGGHQHLRLSPEEISQRLCFFKYCGSHGAIQVRIFDRIEPFRIVCRRHAAVVALVFGRMGGGELPTLLARNISEYLGEDLNTLLLSHPEEPVASVPDDWTCLACGRGLVPDPRHRTWVHNCELTPGVPYRVSDRADGGTTPPNAS